MRGCTVIEAAEIPEQAGAFGQGLRRTQFLVIQTPHGGCRKFDEATAVGSRLVPLVEIILLSRGKPRRGDLRHFLTELINPVIATGCGLEFFQGSTRRGHGSAAFHIGTAFRERLAEAVQEKRLLTPGKKRLVIMGAVKVDKPCPQFLENREIAGASVDELAAGPLGGDRPLQDQLPLLTGIHAVFLKKGVDLGGLTQREEGLDSRGGRSGSDDPAVGPFPKKEFERS